MKTTVPNVIRLSGFAAVAAGLIFAGIQPIHPPDFLPSVTTSAWALITSLKTLMAFLFLLGLTGIYARQVEKAGWLGLAGYLLFSVSLALNMAFIFAEAFIIPLLATETPQYVESFLGIFNGFPGEMNTGALPALYGLTGITYMLGGLLFGIATFRAGVFPRWAAGLLAFVSAVTPAAALLPHALQRYAGIPVGLAIAWLGFALLTERRDYASQPLPNSISHPLPQTGGKRG